MRLVRPRSSHKQSEPAIPLVNVVFIILLFVVATATVEVLPIDVELPTSAFGDEASERMGVFVAADSTLILDHGQVDLAVLENVVAERRPVSLALRADRRADSRTVVRLARRLAAAGAGQVVVLVAPP